MHFLKKILILFVPIIGFLSVPVYVLYVSGELQSTDQVIQKQWEAQKYNQYSRFGSAYMRPELYYKLKSTLVHKPDVLVIGTSRVLQVRQEFFRSDVLFYNAGKGIGQLTDLNYFLDVIPTTEQPKVIILGLDQNFFNDFWLDENTQLSETEKYKGDSALTFLLENTKRVYLNLSKGKISLQELMAPHDGLIGMSSILKHTGYREDGSYYFGNVVELGGLHNPTVFDYNFSDTIQRIHKSLAQFTYGTSVSASSLSALDTFLKKSSERGVRVVAFLPPYPPQVYQELKKQSNDYQYLFNLPNKLEPIFKRHNVAWYNMSDGGAHGCTDFEASDGIHASEKCYARVFLEMAKHDATLKQFVDTSTLNEALNKSTDDQQIFSL